MDFVPFAHKISFIFRKAIKSFFALRLERRIHINLATCFIVTVTELSNSSGMAGELLALDVNNVLLSEQSISWQLSPSISLSVSPSLELLITIAHGS